MYGPDRYRLIAYVQHLGPHPREGHYVSYMVGKEGPAMKYNDKGGTASPVFRPAEDQFQRNKENGYIYYYRKIER